MVEEEDVVENYNPDEPGGQDGVDADPTQSNHHLDSTDYAERNVVASGEDGGAGAGAGGGGGPGLNTVKGIKNKRIPNEKRTTTPYMTKYEKARVLGTRALQIR